MKKADGQDIQIKLAERMSLLVCSCGFFVAMQMPCEHILRILTQKRKEEEVIKYYNQRWLKLEEIRTSDELLEELDCLIEENEKLDHRQKEDVKNVVKEENSEENLLENDGEFGDEEDLL